MILSINVIDLNGVRVSIDRSTVKTVKSEVVTAEKNGRCTVTVLGSHLIELFSGEVIAVRRRGFLERALSLHWRTKLMQVLEGE